MGSIILLFNVFLLPFQAGAAKPSFKLDAGLKRSYMALLEQAADFHKAMDKEDAEAIQREIKETQEIIARLSKQILSVPQFHHKIHSHKLLKTIEEQLAVMNSTPQFVRGNGEKKNIKKLFNSFFELAQVYDLKRDMEDKIFYCSKDKSLWFQEDGKAKNPINTSYKNCGRSIL